MTAPTYAVEQVALDDLTPHPRNYRTHPEDQLAHIIRSIEEHGLYRNIVVARDNTILAGHGVALALRRMGRDSAPVIRLDIAPDDPRALKVLAGDNEIGRLAIVDDRELTELLKAVAVTDLDALVGTGFDEMMLANLVYVTRPEHEIRDVDHAAHWVGMPEYDRPPAPVKLVVTFADDDARADFAERLGVRLTDKSKSLRWPPRQRDDTSSVRWDVDDAEDDDDDA